MTLPPTFSARLLSARNLSPSVRELVFQREDGPLDFDPGQWVSLTVQVGPDPAHTLKRSYSIASAPDGTGRFELAVTRVLNGPVSGALHELAPGAVVRVTGPQGFFARPPGVPSLFVGTGTGITPLRSMLHAALAAGASEPLALILGVRHEQDILYRDELEQLAAAHPGFSVHTTLSRPHEGWAGLTGYVQEHVPALWASLSERAGAAPPHLFLCGLDRMVKAVRERMRKQLGVPREQVHSERFD